MAKINIDEIDIQDIYEFMQTGNVKDAPEDVVRYLELLDKIHGMHLRILDFGTRESIIKHLILTEDLTRYKASLIYDEALEYFYRDSKISKNAWRNIYASKIDNLATAATLMAKDVADLDKITRMTQRAGAMRQLDVPEPPVFPKELFEKPIKVYAMDPEFLGETKINRISLAKQIDELEDLSVIEKEILKQDAAITQITLLPDESENKRRQER
ncbi:hypothetical protein ACI6PS_02535 [Flavobacterium sp. PLA-1-15]|uniref:hypothetical protein n=1 Tax=Flavobacterium sp. PLA-1-15 TaxID=3380533 RepID=UPI003B75F90F